MPDLDSLTIDDVRSIVDYGEGIRDECPTCITSQQMTPELIALARTRLTELGLNPFRIGVHYDGCSLG